MVFSFKLFDYENMVRYIQNNLRLSYQGAKGENASAYQSIWSQVPYGKGKVW